jgi:hypothetical protein
MNFQKDIEHFLYTPASRLKENGKPHIKNPRHAEKRLDPRTKMNPSEAADISFQSLPRDGIPLGRGMKLKIKSIPYAFTLPHRYHERLEYDVASHHPDARILLNRRVGYLGAATPVRYSLLAYIENRRDVEVKIAGAALNNTEAWSFNTLIPLNNLGIGIAKTLEHIAALPIHNAIDLNNGRSRGVVNKELFANKPFCDKG